MKKGYFWMLPLLSLLFSCGKGTPPAAGYYGDHVVLGYDPVGDIITGMYYDTKDSIPDPDCSFYFTGKYIGKYTNTIRWLPGQRNNRDIFGFIKMKGQNEFTFYWEENLQNCRDTPDFASKKINLSLTQAEPWLFIQTVRAENAIVHAKPSKEAPALGYVQQDVVLKILHKKGNWVEVVAGKKNQLRGWVYYKNLKSFPS